MKIRNVVWNEKTGTNKVIWFGSRGKDPGTGKAIREKDYLDISSSDVDKIKEYKRIEIVNSLSVLKGELKHAPKFGISLLDKTTKTLLDIEIMDILRSQLSLVINVFESKQVGRGYAVYFEATTPEGVEVDVNYNYNFVL